MRGIAKTAVGLALAMSLVACGQESQPKPGEVDVFGGIGEGEVIRLLGTEPFWSATIEGARLNWLTPENPRVLDRLALLLKYDARYPAAVQEPAWSAPRIDHGYRSKHPDEKGDRRR